jgi:peroxiredoxin
VAWNGTDDSYLNFIDRHSLTFDNLDDTAALVFSEYDIPSQPAWAFINQDGTVDTQMGVIPQDELINLLEALS